MSNIFNKNRENKKSLNIFNNNINNMRIPEKKSNDKNPVTIIKKNPSKDKNRREQNRKNDEKQMMLQKKQDRNLSKKAIKNPNNISPEKKKQNNFKDNNINKNNNNKDNNNKYIKNNHNIKDAPNINNNKNINNNDNNNNDIDNNENDKYTKKLENKLLESSKDKNSFIQKEGKKNDFLKVSINLNVDPFLDSNTKDNDNEDSNNNKRNKLVPNEFNYNSNITKNKMNNPSVFLFQEDKTNKNKNNNEPYKLKGKEFEKINQNPYVKRMSFNQNIIPNMNNNENDKEGKRASNKKNTYQSMAINKGGEINNPFSIDNNNIDKKQTAKYSTSLKGSLKDSLKRSKTFLKKSTNSSVNNVIIPLSNKTKENNCFLNVIIQCLFHLGGFKKELLEFNPELGQRSRILRELYGLFTSYAGEQQKNKDNKNQIEPTLSVNELRNYLNNLYHCYQNGECGDPMETIGYILDVIHRTFCKRKNINYKKVECCKCPSHQYFHLKLVDIISCPNCNVKKVQFFDKDCYMFNIAIKDITKKLHGKSVNTYKLKLFSKLKENNETYENENKLKIPGCNCNPQMMSLYEKKLKLNGPSSTYLIINITWAEQFPNMQEILKCYCLIPMSDNIENLFTFMEDIKTKINDKFYIKSVILYGIYHYVCIIYLREQKKWAIIDDKTIKYMSKYYDLIDFLLRNHLMPVGLIYSKDRRDEISESEIKAHVLSKEEYKKLYDFCKDVDVRRGLKISDIVLSKNSFNENNENYLNNNYFYKSIITFDDSKKNITRIKDSKNMYQNKDNNLSNKSIDKFNKDNNLSNKSINKINKDNNIEQNDESPKKEKKNVNFFKGKNVFGDFSNNNMKGGIIILSSSNNDNQNNEKSGQTKEESDFNDFGKNYVGDDYK